MTYIGFDHHKKWTQAAGLVVTLPEENLLPVIATGDHVVKLSFGMNSRRCASSFPIKR
jgi:hypothetical protein